MKQLVVNADDFGRTPGINRGILDAHLKGIVTSTTVMINYPDAAAGLELAQREAPRLGLGLHLTLTAARPVLPPAEVPTLVKADGTFFHIREWAAASQQFSRDDFRREMRAQLERFTALAGHPPDHLDSHHHAAYLHPLALGALLDLAAETGLPLRAAQIDQPESELAAALDDWLPGLPPGAAAPWLDELRAVIAEGPPVYWPARFESGYYGARAALGDLLVLLTTLPEDSLTELMCHPGYVDAGLAGSAYSDQRADEVEHLTARATLECVRDEGLQLINYGDLSVQRGTQ